MNWETIDFVHGEVLTLILAMHEATHEFTTHINKHVHQPQTEIVQYCIHPQDIITTACTIYRCNWCK